MMRKDYWDRRGLLTALLTGPIAEVTGFSLIPRLLSAQTYNFDDVGPITPSRLIEPRRIVVVGAGLAGLSAAYELKNLGHNVTVLEARNRPGGRVCTLREGLSDGMKVEAGAMNFYNSHRYSTRYCVEFDLPLRPMFPGLGAFAPAGLSGIYYIQGKAYRASDVMTDPSILPYGFTANDVKILKNAPSFEAPLSLIDFMVRYFGAGDIARLQGIDLPQMEDLRDLDRIPIGEYLKRLGVSKGYLKFIGLVLDIFYDNNSLERISPLYILNELAIGLRTGHRYRIIGGNDQLPKAFADKLSGLIRYGSPVTSIEQNDSNARVVYLQGGIPQTLSCDYVVCALPLPMLRLVKVTPPFPTKKARAIDEVPYASIHKVILQCRKRYWEEQKWSGEANTDLPLGSLYHATAYQRTVRGVLATNTSAPGAKEMASLSDQQQRDITLEQISKFSPDIRKHVENHLIWDWDKEEWNRGAYAVFETGQMSTHLPELGRPEGRVHFAGEHTSFWHAYMNGALESGNRCAREIQTRSETELVRSRADVQNSVSN